VSTGTAVLLNNLEGSQAMETKVSEHVWTLEGIINLAN
jgi:hypothetical protein